MKNVMDKCEAFDKHASDRKSKALLTGIEKEEYSVACEQQKWAVAVVVVAELLGGKSRKFNEKLNRYKPVKDKLSMVTKGFWHNTHGGVHPSKRSQKNNKIDKAQENTAKAYSVCESIVRTDASLTALAINVGEFYAHQHSAESNKAITAILEEQPCYHRSIVSVRNLLQVDVGDVSSFVHEKKFVKPGSVLTAKMTREHDKDPVKYAKFGLKSGDPTERFYSCNLRKLEQRVKDHPFALAISVYPFGASWNHASETHGGTHCDVAFMALPLTKRSELIERGISQICFKSLVARGLVFSWMETVEPPTAEELAASKNAEGFSVDSSDIIASVKTIIEQVPKTQVLDVIKVVADITELLEHHNDSANKSGADDADVGDEEAQWAFLDGENDDEGEHDAGQHFVVSSSSSSGSSGSGSGSSSRRSSSSSSSSSSSGSSGSGSGSSSSSSSSSSGPTPKVYLKIK
jgi:uncharacterized membrane protein YgcG